MTSRSTPSVPGCAARRPRISPRWLWLLATALSLPAWAQSPTVTSLAPGRNALSAPRTTTVTVSFSQPVTAASASNLRLHSTQLRGRRPGTVSGGGSSTLSFDPAQDLLPGELLTVSIPASLLSSGGAAASKQVYQFRAAAAGTGRGDFTGAQEAAVYAGPLGVVLGDVDNDGDLDLLTVDSNTFEVSVSLNTGNGTFGAPQNVGVGNSPTGLALADVDNDGDLDIVATDAQSTIPGVVGGAVIVCPNQGNGTFLAAAFGAVAYTVGFAPNSVAVGDVDADGDVDIVAGNTDSGTVSVLLNNGTGAYASITSVAVGTGPQAVALGDIDGDGDLDLLTANSGTGGSGSVSIRLNNGSGSFTGIQSLPVGSYPRRLKLGDVDGDGDLDILTTSPADNTITLRRNNGGNTYASSVTLPVGRSPQGLDLADVDADGDLDLLTAHALDNSVGVYLNTGSGAFTPGAVVPVGQRPQDVALGDIDGDGDLDLATANFNDGTASIRLNGPAVPPVITALLPGAGPVGSSVTLSGSHLIGTSRVTFNGVPSTSFSADASGTSLTAVVPAGASTGPVVLTTWTGSATAPTPFTVAVPVPVRLTASVPGRNAHNAARSGSVQLSFAEPITAASAPDLRVFGQQLRGRRPGTLSGGGTTTLTFTPSQPFAPGEQVSVTVPGSLRGLSGNGALKQVLQFRAGTAGNGQGVFTAAPDLTCSTPPLEIALGDLDGDNDLDLVGVHTDGTFSRGLNNGSGTFSLSTSPSTGLPLQRMALGDVDGDGDLDVVAHSSSGTLLIQPNDGTGSFGAAVRVTTNITTTRRLHLADADADGDLDLFLAYDTGVAIYQNNGTGTFSYLSGFSTSSIGYAYDLTTGDVDADGDLDLVVATYYQVSAAQVGVWLNNGAATFSSAQALPLVGADAVALGDLDQDGDLDLLARHTSGNSAYIRLNNGAGSFSGTGSIALNGTGAVLGDADGDGDLDLLATAMVRFGDGQGGFGGYYPIAAPSNPYYTLSMATGDLDGDGDLDVVATQGGNLVSVRLNGVAPAPTLTGLTPSSGPVGSTVVLTGTNFIGTREVRFNGTLAPGFVVNSNAQLTVTVPAGAITGAVTLTTPAGMAISTGLYTVLTPFNVTSFSPARNATSAPRAAAVAVSFREAISTSSSGELRVYGNRHGLLTGTRTGGGTSTLTFTPAQPFAPGEQLSVSLPSTLASPSGGNVRRQVYQFTAAAGGLGTGQLRIGSSTGLTLNSSYAELALGDLDGDGDLDAISTSGPALLNDGTGTSFTNGPGSVSFGGGAAALALGDMNGDGRLDAVGSSGQVSVGTSIGGFVPLPTQSFIYDSRDVALGDLNADGFLDMAVPVYGRDSVYVRFNNGYGLLNTQHVAAVGSRPVGIVLGDVDNDGDLDILTANEASGSNGTVSVCLNTGDGLFSRGQQLLVGSSVRRLALGDLDGDGDLDLVINNGQVRLGDGSGSFGAATQTLGGGYDVLLGDLDADGDLDVVLTGSGTSGALVRFNNGSGTFSGTQSLTLPGSFYGGELGDMDGDGDLDLLVVSQSPAVLAFNERIAPPSITTLSPGSGLTGATVVIGGTDLIGTSSVTFNGTAAPGFVVNSATQITATVPAGATTGPVSVTNPVGTGASPQPFTVLQPVSVLSVAPARNATAAPSTSSVAATFSQALSTNEASSLSVFSAQRGGRLSGTRTGAGSSTLGFAPAQPFRPGEVVSVSLPAYTEAGQSRVLKQAYQFTAAVTGSGRGYFGPATTYPVSSAIGTQAIGDIDGDGDLDLVSAHYNSLIATYFNSGSGTFTAGSTLPANNATVGLVLGDVDGDGDLDLAACSSSASVVSVRLNNGQGVFSGTLDVPVGGGPFALRLADLDADGDLDVVTVNRTGNGENLSVSLNDGTGRFAPAVTRLPANGIISTSSNLEIGDLDGDGDLDLVHGSAVFLNNGQGEFLTARTPVGTPNTASAIRLGDLDGDGDLDLVAISYSSIGGQPSYVSIRPNNGTGTLTTGPDLPVTSGAIWLTLDDIDADGDLDLLTSGNTNRLGQVRLNDGQGNFTYLTDLPLTSDEYGPLLRDLDNDGDLDLLTSSTFAATPTFSVRLNGATPVPIITSFTPGAGPAGTFVTLTGLGFVNVSGVSFNGTAAPSFTVASATSLTVTVPPGATTGPITVTSAGGTGASATPFTVLPLVLVTNRTPAANATGAPRAAPVVVSFANAVTAATAGTLRVYGNRQRGLRPGTLSGGGSSTLIFTPSQPFAPGEQVSVSLPATMLTSNGGVVQAQVFQFTAATGGTGLGTFQGRDETLNIASQSITSGDIDNDGDLDLLMPAVNSSQPGIEVRLNNGLGSFVPAANIPSYTASHLALADLDRDGDLDLLTACDSYVGVHFNNGFGTFGAAQTFTAFSTYLELGDVDADGDLDVVTTYYQSGLLSVLLNNGSGQLTLAGPLSSPSPLTVALGDVDADGDLDAVVASGTRGVMTHLNNGRGSFGAGVLTSLPGETRSAALGDVDGDGDLDVVAGHTNNPDYWATVLLNNAAGTFSAAQAVPVGRVNRVYLGDLDHDADLDLVALNNSNDVSIRLNNGAGSFSGSYTLPMGSNSTCLTLSDLDGDGDLDFAAVTATSGSNYLGLRFNQPLSPNATRNAAAGLIELYPNPASRRCEVRLPAGLFRPATPAQVQLLNVLGQVVRRQPLPATASGAQTTLDLQGLALGLYTVRVQLGAEVLTRQLLVQ